MVLSPVWWKKQSGREFVNPEFPVFNTLAIQKDQGDSWLLYESPVIGDTWKPQILPDPMPARMPIKEYFFTRTKHGFPCDRTDYQNNCIEIIERGPVRAGLKISGTLVLNDEVKVPYEQCIYLYDQPPPDRFYHSDISCRKALPHPGLFPDLVLKRRRSTTKYPSGSSGGFQGNFPPSTG